MVDHTARCSNMTTGQLGDHLGRVSTLMIHTWTIILDQDPDNQVF